MTDEKSRPVSFWGGKSVEPIAQPAPVQEPVAWYRDEDGIRIYYESKVWDDATPLYTTPPAAHRPWVGLSGEEIQTIWRHSEHMDVNEVCQAIEAKLRKKNDAAQPAVPDAITDDSESPEYRTGWNDCRQAMMEMMK